MAQIWPDLASMEDGCAMVMVLWSPSFPPASDSLSRFWVYGELPGGGGDSLLVVSPGRLVWGSLWLEGVVVMRMRRAEFFSSSKPEVAVCLPPTSFPVTACVASISAVRVWFFGPDPVVLASFYSAWSGGCCGFIIVSSLQIKAVIGLVVGVLVVPVGDFGFLEYTGASELQEGGVEVAVCGDWWLVLRQALVHRFCRLDVAPLSSTASSKFWMVSVLSAGGGDLW
ncbi:hypothetical protein HID58_028663 [Brassica napus]|uniref:Uncharacterized protein n=1 Tax=Brassica napus TaxID=3708 RepID=A0ABQ8CAW2_BRANA|nr:hypothetical protein HID58_028663 [Brassica napus]